MSVAVSAAVNITLADIGVLHVYWVRLPFRTVFVFDAARIEGLLGSGSAGRMTETATTLLTPIMCHTDFYEVFSVTEVAFM
jgi:hypothetical protein